jgi:ubiquinone/menaquinone biosynthesis C-methylase UbiE
MSKRKQTVVKAVQEEVADEYDSKTYWDKRYEESNGHEWYYSFDLLLPLFEKYLSKDFSGSILELGCGDKPLLPGFEIEFKQSECLIGIDYSQNVVDLLNKDKQKDSIIKYQQMDARRTNLNSNSFDFIVDKGTMDAMLSAKSAEQGYANVSKIFLEAVRVLKLESQFVIVSHIEADSEEFHELMQGVILPALDTKRNVLWDIEAHEVSQRCNVEDTEGSGAKKQKGGSDSGRGTVYIISSKPRKFTRTMLTCGAPVGFKVLQYDSDSDEEGDEEGSDDEDDQDENE